MRPVQNIRFFYSWFRITIELDLTVRILHNTWLSMYGLKKKVSGFVAWAAPYVVTIWLNNANLTCAFKCLCVPKFIFHGSKA